MYTFLVRTTLVLILGFNTLLAGATEPMPKEYFENLTKQAINFLQEPVVNDIKIKNLLKSHLDIELMAKRSLGNERSKISSEQFTRYLQVYSHFVLNMTQNLVKKYYTDKLIIKDVKELKQKKTPSPEADKVKRWILYTEVGDKLKINYMIYLKNGEYRVFDILTEGISLTGTHKAEFSSLIQAQGIEGLITDLQQRIGSK